MIRSGLSYSFLLVLISGLFSCKSDTKEVVKRVDNQAKEITSPVVETSTDIIDHAQAGATENPTEAVLQEELTKSAEPPVSQERKQVTKPKAKEAPIQTKPKVISYAKPAIQFETSTYDFGTLEEGETFDYAFKFKNTGNAPLEITSASGTCGCAQPSFPFLEIPPGGTNQIGVHYNSVNKEGDQDPEIYITTNIDDSKIKLTLTGTVNVSDERRKEKEEAIAKQKKAIAEAAAIAKKKREEKEKIIKARVDSILQAEKDTSKTINPK